MTITVLRNNIVSGHPEKGKYCVWRCLHNNTFFGNCQDVAKRRWEFRMLQLNDFGVTVKKRLIDMGKNQTWLIGAVQRETGMYIDHSYLNRLMTDRATSAPMCKTIYQILGIAGKEDK